MSSGIVFHALAAFGYFLLSVAHWRHIPAEHTDAARPTRETQTLRFGLAFALLLHGIGLQQSILVGPAIYLSWSLALSVAFWLGLVVFWIESQWFRIDGLLLLLLPCAALTTALAALFPEATLVAHAGNPWLRIHLLIALAAYALITVVAAHAMLMAALDRHLHRPFVPEAAEQATHGLLSRTLEAMPPLLVQERILFRLIWIAFGALTLTVITGSLASWMISGRILPMDHKTIFTLLSWLTFGLLLIGRHRHGWRGRIALRWTMTGFGFMLLAYTGTRFVLENVLTR